MKINETSLQDCFMIEPVLFEDHRGYFYEGFNEKKLLEETKIDFNVKQINQSRSYYGVLRGLHFQNEPKAQAKLVSCLEGEVLDVAVDLRSHSSTFGKYFAIRLSHINKKSLFIPKGMAHGFLVLSDSAKLMYLVDEFYSPEHESGIAYNDPELNINWEIPHEKIILSEKDLQLKTMAESKINFDHV